VSRYQLGSIVEEDKIARQRLRASSQGTGCLGQTEPVVQPAARDQCSGGRFCLSYKAGEESVSSVDETEGARDERVKMAPERLRELEDSGVELSEILGGSAGGAFVLDDCEGDPDLAQAAFALVHSSKSQSERP
jgi:hypothetical protein